VLIIKENKSTHLFFLAGMFITALTEFVVTGLLTQIAHDMKTSLSSAGLLVSVYAISVAIFGPLVRIYTFKISPHILLPILVGVFIFSNTIAIFAPNFNVLLISRLLSATMHAPFSGICMSVASTIAPKGKETNAIALVQSGATIAVLVGVPIGTLLGDVIHWRIVFVAMVLIAIIVLLGLIKYTPHITLSTEVNIAKELAMFKNPHILLILVIIIFGYAGIFTTYTFIEPMIQKFSPFNIYGLSLCLFMFGIGGVIGNVVTGKVIERKLTKSLLYILILLAIVLFIFTIALKFASTAVLICLLFGFGTFGTLPLLNSKIILTATESPLLSGTIAAAVFNLANFIGAISGSILLYFHTSYLTITYISVLIIICGILLTIINNIYENRCYFH
jgi:DHA1 family inner membrane transport protein